MQLVVYPHACIDPRCDCSSCMWWAWQGPGCCGRLVLCTERKRQRHMDSVWVLHAAPNHLVHQRHRIHLHLFSGGKPSLTAELRECTAHHKGRHMGLPHTWCLCGTQARRTPASSPAYLPPQHGALSPHRHRCSTLTPAASPTASTWYCGLRAVLPYLCRAAMLQRHRLRMPRRARL